MSKLSTPKYAPGFRGRSYRFRYSYARRWVEECGLRISRCCILDGHVHSVHVSRGGQLRVNGGMQSRVMECPHIAQTAKVSHSIHLDERR